MKRNVFTSIILISLLILCANAKETYDFPSLQEEESVLKQNLDSIEYWIDHSYISKALSIIDETEKLALESDNKKYIARVYRLRSGLYISVQDLEGFETYLEKATILQKQIQDQYGEMYINNLWGLYHKRISKDNDKAIFFLKKAIDGAEKHKYEEQSIDMLVNLTSIYYRNADWKNCYEASQKAIELAKKYHKDIRLIYLYYRIGTACSKTNRYDEALNFFRKGEEIAKREMDSTKTSNYANHTLYLAGIADVYDRKKEYKLANDYYKDYIQEQAKQNNIFLEKYAQDIKAYKELQLKQKDNERVLAENKYQQAQLKLNESLLISGIVIIVILVLLVLLQYKNSRLKTENNVLLQQKNQELLKAKNRVEEVYKQKTLFINNITHELRTPLHAINGIAHLLENKESNENQRKKQLNILQFSGKYLLRFINDIIELNRSDEAYKTSLKKHPFDPVKLVNTIKESLNFFIIGENNNDFKFLLDDKLPKQLLGDSDHLSRIIISILSNMSRYVNGGVIEFSVQHLFSREKINTILFSLKSKNLYFSKKKQEELNKAFIENESAIFTSLSDENNLPTLELVIANKLLLQCNSRLDFILDEKEGTIFSFQIPFEHIEQKIGQAEFNDKKKKDVKILVVEDNKINQLITRKIITNFGYHCEIASDGYEALKMTEKNGYDLIFMDIMMEGIDGFETTKRIRKSDKKTPIIALTAISESENKENFVDAGITKVINKPFEPVTLLEQIQIVIPK
ncbi:response regulator [Aquimarina macrocephali]|uniref:response regulator n=1 Tax=Aquimarina macrocephali TaxID=666563 RepID=UPI003F660CC2